MKSKKIRVREELIEKVKAKALEDPYMEHEDVRAKRNLNTKLYPLIQHFIAEHLKKYDTYIAKEYEGGTEDYFSEKTLKRAISEEKMAMPQLIEVLGYYAYGDEWDNEKSYFLPVKAATKKPIILAKEPKTELEQNISENISKKIPKWKQYLPFLSILSVMSIFTIIIIEVIQNRPNQITNDNSSTENNYEFNGIPNPSQPGETQSEDASEQTIPINEKRNYVNQSPDNVPIKRTPTAKAKPPQKEEKKAMTFSSNSVIVSEGLSKLGLKQSFGKETDFDIEFGISSGIQKLDEHRYYFPTDKLVIKINGQACHFSDSPRLIVKSSGKIPGNELHHVERELENKINQIIQNHQTEIIETIKKCIPETSFSN